MEQTTEHFDANSFRNYLLALDGPENLSGELLRLSEKHGVVVPFILSEVAVYKNQLSWLKIAGWLWSFRFSYVEGAEGTSLYLFKKAHALDPSDVTILEALLDFSGPPEKLSDIEEAKQIANRILELDHSHERARQILGNLSN